MISILNSNFNFIVSYGYIALASIAIINTLITIIRLIIWASEDVVEVTHNNRVGAAKLGIPLCLIKIILLGVTIAVTYFYKDQLNNMSILLKFVVVFFMLGLLKMGFKTF